jgi:DnaJ domain
MGRARPAAVSSTAPLAATPPLQRVRSPWSTCANWPIDGLLLHFYLVLLDTVLNELASTEMLHVRLPLATSWIVVAAVDFSARRNADFRGYYALLGIDDDVMHSATSSDIRRAYRRAAKRLHPDAHGATMRRAELPQQSSTSCSARMTCCEMHISASCTTQGQRQIDWKAWLGDCSCACYLGNSLSLASSDCAMVVLNAIIFRLLFISTVPHYYG